jgi:hypothetical protein
MSLGIRLSVNIVRVEYDGVKGRLDAGLPRKQHDRFLFCFNHTVFTLLRV